MRAGSIIQSGLRGFADLETSLKAIKKLLPFSIVFFRSDFSKEEDLKDLIKKINHLYKIEAGIDPPIIAVDQEGGNVVRMPWLDYNPSNFFTGSFNNLNFTHYVGRLTGNQLLNLGIRWNLAPVLDILNGYNQVILERSFSEKVEIVAEHGSCYIKGLQEAGVAATAKHFPGHGGVLDDSHLILPKDSRGFSAVMNDAYPFISAIESRVSSIMLSHVLYDSIDRDYPASLSENIQNLLRYKLKFNGVILTDSVDMKAVSSNYTVSEIVEKSVGNEADVIEVADLNRALEISDYILKIDKDKLEKKVDRIGRILPEKTFSYSPQPDLLNSISLSFNILLRERRLDPTEHIFLVFLDTKPESNVVEEKDSSNSVVKRIRQTELDIEVTDLEKLLKNNTVESQIIFIGRNEHLKDRFTSLNVLSEHNKCVFISTSVSRDLGVISENIGYIAAYSSKTENVVGSIYKALGFF